MGKLVHPCRVKSICIVMSAVMDDLRDCYLIIEQLSQLLNKIAKISVKAMDRYLRVSQRRIHGGVLMW